MIPRHDDPLKLFHDWRRDARGDGGMWLPAVRRGVRQAARRSGSSGRVEGPVARVDRAQSEAYFRARPRGSQISAAASHQSAVLDDRATLLERVAELRRRCGDEPLPCSETYRLVPELMEFWEGKADRLHERLCYERLEGDPPRWRSFELEP